MTLQVLNIFLYNIEDKKEFSVYEGFREYEFLFKYLNSVVSFDCTEIHETAFLTESNDKKYILGMNIH